MGDLGCQAYHGWLRPNVRLLSARGELPTPACVSWLRSTAFGAWGIHSRVARGEKRWCLLLGGLTRIRLCGNLASRSGMPMFSWSSRRTPGQPEPITSSSSCATESRPSGGWSMKRVGTCSGGPSRRSARCRMSDICQTHWHTVISLRGMSDSIDELGVWPSSTGSRIDRTSFFSGTLTGERGCPLSRPWSPGTP